jgi:uncharacterized protein YciI
MKRTRILLAATLGLAALSAAALAQPRRPDPSTMSAYVMGIYVRGPLWTAERTPRTDSIQAGHMANMGKMAAAGALIGAGPFGGQGRYRGLLIFKDLPMDSIRALVVQDPAIQAQRLMIELHRWYAPKGIGDAYSARAKLRPDNPDSMIMVPMAFLSRPPVPPEPDSVAAVRAASGHMAHILDMLTSGKLLAAGPFFDDGPIRGVSFFATDSVTARKLSNDDPAVQAGRLVVEMVPWWTAWGVLPPTSNVKVLGP